MNNTTLKDRARQHGCQYTPASTGRTRPPSAVADDQAVEPKALKAALKLRRAGFWVIVIYPRGAKIKTRDGEKIAGGKEPIGAAWGVERRTEEWIRRKFAEYPDAGIGILFGPERAPGGAWLIECEGDGPQAAESRATFLGGEDIDTPEWRATRGNHAVFTADGDRLLNSLAAAGAKEGTGIKAGVWHLPELPGLEIRVGGSKADGTVKQVQSVVPPTPGIDGNPRAWISPPKTSSPRGGVAPLPEAAYAFLERLAAARQTPASTPKPKPSNGRSGSRSSADAEARAVAYLATIDPAISGQKGHSKTFRAACQVGPGFDLPADVALRILMEHYNPRCEPPWTEAELRHKVDDAYRKEPRRGWLLGEPLARSRVVGPPPSCNGNGRHDAGDDRPAIELTTERHQVADAAVNALVRDPDLFRRGDTLGIVVVECNLTARLPSGVELRDAQGSARFMSLSDANVGCRLTRNATFFKWSRASNSEQAAVNCHPPDWLIKAVASRGHWPGVRTLHTLAGCPYVRADGLMPAVGFDEATGTLYRPSVVLPSLPQRPTQGDAGKAAGRLNEIVRQFPFANGFDWSVWLAALLTSIQRPAIAGPVPGFVFNGNKAGIGKGLLIDVIGIMVWGHPIPTRTYPMDPIEAGKVKLSLALAGVPAVHFDNLPEGGFFGNSEIDSALTSTEVSGRLLGQSRDSGPVPLRPCWFLSGNNVSPSRDAYRRWLPCNLLTPLESPHERSDIERQDLRKWVHGHRAELLRDALVILRAHAVAGRPIGNWGPLGSFEEWDGAIRGAVWFATGNDCLTTQRKAAEEMPDRLDKLTLLEGWSQLPRGDSSGLTVKDAIAMATEDPRAYVTLHSALTRMSKDGKLPSYKQVIYRIRGMNGQNIGGRKFERCGETREHDSLWKVAKG